MSFRRHCVHLRRPFPATQSDSSDSNGGMRRKEAEERTGGSAGNVKNEDHVRVVRPLDPGSRRCARSCRLAFPKPAKAHLEKAAPDGRQ